MLKLGEYIPGDTALHCLDPRVKIGTTMILSLIILRGVPLTCMALSIMIFLLVFFFRLPIRTLIQSLKPVFLFILILFVLHLFFSEGKPIPPFPVWKLTATYEGLLKGGMIGWQFSLLVLVGIVLTMITTPSELVCGLEWLLKPLKWVGLPAHDLALMVSLALRFLPVFIDEFECVKAAQISRGAVFHRGSPVRRIKALVSLINPVVLGTLRRADDLATAMQARGYTKGRAPGS
jgi:energy-coupling factor transporter transmembrane protein EcfT